MPKRIVHDPTAPRVVYQSERIRIDYEAGDYLLYLDGSFVKPYRTEGSALVAAQVSLEEQARELAVDLADEAAALALEAEERYLNDVRALCADLSASAPLTPAVDFDMERRAYTVGPLAISWEGRPIGEAGNYAFYLARVIAGGAR